MLGCGLAVGVHGLNKTPPSIKWRGRLLGRTNTHRKGIRPGQYTPKDNPANVHSQPRVHGKVNVSHTGGRTWFRRFYRACKGTGPDLGSIPSASIPPAIGEGEQGWSQKFCGNFPDAEMA